EAVIAENLQRLIHFVAEVRTVVVAVQFDIRDLGLREPCRRVGQRFSTESPVAPGEFEARLELIRLQLAEALLNLAVGFFKMLLTHVSVLLENVWAWRPALQPVRRPALHF